MPNTPFAHRVVCLTLVVVLLRLAAPAASLQQRQYLYVAVPGVDSDSSPTSAGTPTSPEPESAGVSLLVFDIAQGHKFVRRMPLWPRAQEPERVRGLTVASAPGGTAGSPTPGASRLYMSTTRRLAAIDPMDGRVIWEHEYEGHCCERPAVSPDGRSIYAPALGSPVWYVIDAATGTVTTTIPVVGWPRSTAYARDGRHVYLAAWESRSLSVVDAASKAITAEAGPFTGFMCPFTINRKASMAFANVDGLVGFEVVDLLTGLLLDRVQIDDYQPDELQQFECPSHGIAFTPDEKELWVADGVGNRLRVFDSVPYPPVEKVSIQLARQPRWITMGADGRYAYASTGEVVDVSQKRIVGVLKDDGGRLVESERMAEIATVLPAAGGAPQR
ncbi:MAG: hypothetical protein ABI051_08135 [Vicinamibacterales bacterium]